MKHLIFTFVLATVIAPLSAYAQLDTVYVPSDVPPAEGNLNDSIQAAINTGALSSTVFKLQPDGCYILTGSITTPPGSKLTIVAPYPGTTQAAAPPQILWSSNDSVTTGFMFDCFGDVTFKNVWLLFANTAGTQVSSGIQVEDNPAADQSGSGEHAAFYGVIFDYCPVPYKAGGCVTISAKDFKGRFENCYFRNDIDPKYRYYGRALSFPYAASGWHSDSVSFENCTFANLGYVYQQEDGNYAEYVSFNHCTFLNIMMFAIESGWWRDLAVTNCIFENTFMYGNIPAYNVPVYGVVNIDSVSDFGFTVPFTDQQRHILFSNNSYSIQPWLADWMKNNPYSQNMHTTGQDNQIPVPQPMMNARTIAFFDTTNSNGAKLFPYMNMVDVYDSVSPHFTAPPTNIDSIEQFLYEHWSASNNVNWAYQPDSDNKRIWPMEESLAYTNDTLLTAAMSGFPLGDLYHWFPAKYAAWNAQAPSEHNRISHELVTGGIVSTPAAPRLVSPPNGSKDLTGNITLKWNKDSLASGYQVQASLDPNFTDPNRIAVDDQFVADTTLTIRVGLGTPYYWRVLAYDEWGKSLYSALDTFTTELIPAIEVPKIVSPPNGSTNRTPPFTLVCSRTSDASQFHWQIRTDTIFSSAKGFVINDSTVDTTRTATLQPGTKYYWRVQGVNPVGASVFTAADSFTVMALPGVPVLAYPGKNAMNVRADTLTLVWHPAVRDSGYVCQLWSGPATATSVVTDSTNDTSFTFTNLKNLTEYYWHVAAFDPAGTAGYSATDSFTTIIAKPQQPIAELPDGSSGVPRMATFSWNTAKLATSYEMQVSPDSKFTTVVMDTAVEDTIVQISDTLSANTIYYWRVAAANEGGQSAFSNVMSFKTGTGILGVEQKIGIPKAFALRQNYPNPFNPATTIRFDLKENSSVRIIIYDILGQRVREFDLGELDAGTYNRTVDMSRYASGIYFYRIDARGRDGERFVSMKKMALIK